jgi:hypothetical protein
VTGGSTTQAALAPATAAGPERVSTTYSVTGADGRASRASPGAIAGTGVPTASGSGSTVPGAGGLTPSGSRRTSAVPSTGAG